MDDCESLDRVEPLEPGGRAPEPGARPWGPLPARRPLLVRSQPGSMKGVWGSGREAGSPARAEDRLARLAAAVGPLRRVLAAIAERLIATRAHERLCYARLSDYARERPGLSARQLQELARVHRALGALPILERALVANELSWSKLRLVARVAKPEDEHDWIARAQALTTRQLEREVRASAPRAEPELPDDAEPRQRVRLRCTPSVLESWHLARELAQRVAGRRLSAAEALELVSAEVFSAISIDPAFAETVRGVAGAADQVLRSRHGRRGSAHSPSSFRGSAAGRSLPPRRVGGGRRVRARSPPAARRAARAEPRCEDRAAAACRELRRL